MRVLLALVLLLLTRTPPTAGAAAAADAPTAAPPARKKGMIPRWKDLPVTVKPKPLGTPREKAARHFGLRERDLFAHANASRGVLSTSSARVETLRHDLKGAGQHRKLDVDVAVSFRRKMRDGDRCHVGVVYDLDTPFYADKFELARAAILSTRRGIRQNDASLLNRTFAVFEDGFYIGERTSVQVRSIQIFFTHRSVSTFDRVTFQLTGELFLYGMALVQVNASAFAFTAPAAWRRVGSGAKVLATATFTDVQIHNRYGPVHKTKPGEWLWSAYYHAWIDHPIVVARCHGADEDGIIAGVPTVSWEDGGGDVGQTGWVVAAPPTKRETPSRLLWIIPVGVSCHKPYVIWINHAMRWLCAIIICYVVIKQPKHEIGVFATKEEKDRLNAEIRAYALKYKEEHPEVETVEWYEYN